MGRQRKGRRIKKGRDNIPSFPVEKVLICGICGREPTKIYKHHITPRAKGGLNKGTVDCCKTCSQQVHMLFTEGELSKMTLEDLVNTEQMKKYIKWIKKRPSNYKARLSKRIKNNRR